MKEKTDFFQEPIMIIKRADTGRELMTVGANTESNDLGCCRGRRRPTQSGNSGNFWKKIFGSFPHFCCNCNEIYRDVSTFFKLLQPIGEKRRCEVSRISLQHLDSMPFGVNNPSF